jgi:DNA-binding NarL/FixJ family response regulator
VSGRAEGGVRVLTTRQRPTRRQLETLRAYIVAGSIAAAADDLGITETTARQHLSGLYRRTGCLNAAQAAYLLGRADIASGRSVPEVSSRRIERRLD